MSIGLQAWRCEDGAALPPGWCVHTATPEWADRLLDAHNAAFADHWGFAPWTPTEWQQWDVVAGGGHR